MLSFSFLVLVAWVLFNKLFSSQLVIQMFVFRNIGFKYLTLEDAVQNLGWDSKSNIEIYASRIELNGNDECKYEIKFSNIKNCLILFYYKKIEVTFSLSL